MKKACIILSALALTALLIALSPHALPSVPEQPSVALTRVWVVSGEGPLAAWLKKQAAAFERESGGRVYIRSATAEEALEARTNAQALRPDCILQRGEGDVVARKGYALIVRDDNLALETPAPTGVLFYRPTAAIAPASSPAPETAPPVPDGVLCAREWTRLVAHPQRSTQPAAEFAAGKAPAAILTAGEAAGLPFGYRAYALPDAAIDFGVSAFSTRGEAFAARLRSEEAQYALAAWGYYAYAPGMRLYDASRPTYQLIENALAAQKWQ